MKIFQKTFFNITFWLTFSAAVLLPGPIQYQTALAAFYDDTEKIEPEFTRMDNTITAKLIPRAKRTSVLITFEVTGGRLIEVAGLDFKKAARPKVNYKDFKSNLFVAGIEDVPKGAEVALSITSDFFTSSTEYWIFNEKSETAENAWMNSNAENISFPNLVQKLVVKVKDGGQFDSDGVANGRITVIGGPKDSFWGYALGTLFIRFFGIFLVLSVLMVGMILSGKIFSLIEKKNKKDGGSSSRTPEADSPDQKTAPVPIKAGPGEEAAAITMALHLHFAAIQSPEPVQLVFPAITSWTQQGREQILGERSLVFNRRNK